MWNICSHPGSILPTSFINDLDTTHPIFMKSDTWCYHLICWQLSLFTYCCDQGPLRQTGIVRLAASRFTDYQSANRPIPDPAQRADSHALLLLLTTPCHPDTASIAGLKQGPFDQIDNVIYIPAYCPIFIHQITRPVNLQASILSDQLLIMSESYSGMTWTVRSTAMIHLL